jgi:hypothetical protein
MAGLALLPPEKGPAYYENACRMSATAIRHVLEDLVSSTAWPVYSPFAREHFGRGKAEGIAEGKAVPLRISSLSRAPLTGRCRRAKKPSRRD